MLFDRGSRAEIAERIAATENRQSKLRVRIKRLKDEGSDASQEEEVLGLLRKPGAALSRAGDAAAYELDNRHGRVDVISRAFPPPLTFRPALPAP